MYLRIRYSPHTLYLQIRSSIYLSRLCTSSDLLHNTTTALGHPTNTPSSPLSSLISQFHLLTHHSAIMFASSVPCLASLRTDDQVSVLTDTVPLIAAYRQVRQINPSDLIPSLVSRLELNFCLNQFLISLHGCKFCL